MAEQPHEIILKFDEEGNLTAEVTGIAGPSCKAASAWLDELGDVVEDKNTDEFYATPAANIIIIGANGAW